MVEGDARDRGLMERRGIIYGMKMRVARDSVDGRVFMESSTRQQRVGAMRHLPLWWKATGADSFRIGKSSWW